MSALAADPPRLDLAALAIATLANPTLDAAACLHTLDALAARVQVEVERHLEEGESLARLRALRHVLADIEGFRGNEHDYYAPENSFLDHVLEHKVGLPITLSVVYLEVARRAGIPLYGVAFPGHFLVACNAGDHKLVMDPFHNGDILTEHGLRGAAQAGGAAAALRSGEADAGAGGADHLPDAVQPQARVPGAARTRSAGWRWWTCCCCWRRTTRVSCARGRCCCRRWERSAPALKDVERCLELSPEAPDRDRLELMAKELRERLANLN